MYLEKKERSRNDAIETGNFGKIGITLTLILRESLGWK